MLRRVIGIRKPWGTFAVLCGLLFWLLARQLAPAPHPKPDAQPYGVMGTFWSAGAAARSGLNPYVEYPDTWRPHAFAKNGPVVLDLNLNPPALLPAFSLVSRFSLHTVARVWRVLSMLILLSVAGILTHRYHPDRHQLWWLLTGGAAIGTLTLQQDYTLLFAIAALAWLALESEQDVAAGLLLGVLCAIKPNFGVWPLLLALSGRRRPSVYAAIVFIAVSVLPIILYGPSVYSEWLRAVSIDSHSIFPSDVSFVGNATRFGARPLGYVAAVLGLSLAVLRVRMGKLALRSVSGLAICVALLCSPLAWMHYVLILAPVMLSRKWTRREQVAAWLLWINPVFLEPSNPSVSHWSLAVRGLPYLLAFLLLAHVFASRVATTSESFPAYDAASVIA